MVLLPRLYAFALTALLAGGCSNRTPQDDHPAKTLVVDIGAVDPGRRSEFRVRVPASRATSATIARASSIESGSNAITGLHYAGQGPGYIELMGWTDGVDPQAESFESRGSVIKGGRPLIQIRLKGQVRQPFHLASNSLFLHPGFAAAIPIKVDPRFPAPRVVDKTSGLYAVVVPLGKSSAKLVVRRVGPPLVPGGFVRVMLRRAGLSRVVDVQDAAGDGSASAGIRSISSGWPLDSEGRIQVGAASALTPDKKGVQVVLDPPGRYAVANRRYENKKFTVTLVSISRHPEDVLVGFCYNGNWAETHRFEIP